MTFFFVYLFYLFIKHYQRNFVITSRKQLKLINNTKTMKNIKLYTAILALSLITSFNSFAGARVQVIHNSADMAAETVDVWLDDTLLLDDFMFRTASPFIDAPSNQEFTISIKGPDSQNAENPIWSQNYTLDEGETYVLIANGIVSQSGYMPMEPFDIYVYTMGREMATNNDNTDLLIFHGSTDAPTVDIVEIGQGAGIIIDDISYGTFNGYLELPTEDYVLDIRDMSGENSVVKYAAPLSTLGLDGAALIAVASGFLNPDNNSNGDAFGLWVALPTGGELIPLPEYSNTARVQVIHNSADMAAEVVDVWLNNTLLIDNFEFRTSSPFIDAPANEEFTISIQGPDSQSSENPIWSQNYTLEGGETYVLIANGIVSAEGYDPVKPFDIYVFAQGREMARSTENTDVLIFHGSTDAPTVDIVEIAAGAGTIVNDLMYGDYADYLELPTDNYQLDIRDETGTTTVVSYLAPLADLNLQAYSITVVASGFLSPENNSNGEDFGLWVSLPDGGDLVALPLATTSVNNNNIEEANFNIFPNPANSNFNVQFDLKENSEVDINIYNILGNSVKTISLGNITAKTYNESINVADLTTGLYIVSIQSENSTNSKKLHINN